MNEVSNTVDWTEIWIITGVGYSVVFVALLLLVFLFNSVPKILNLKIGGGRKKPEKAGLSEAGRGEKYISGETSAAIAMALALYFKEQHDEESGIITIKRVARTYSPWSSKIYGVNNTPR